MLTTVSVAFAAVILAACSSSSGSGPSSAGSSSDASSPYVVGFSDGLTGVDASEGQAELLWAKAVYNTINAAGGIHGHKIKLISLDQGDPGSGQAAANVLQLAGQDHASAITGMLISNDCASAVPTADRYQVPLLCTRVPLSNLSPVDKDVYLTISYEPQEVLAEIALVKKLVSKPNPRVAVLGVDNIGTEQWIARWQSDASSAGLTVSTAQVQPATATSISSEVAAIIASHPDAVAVEVFGQFYQPLLEGLKNAGLNIPVIAVTGTTIYSTLSAPDFANLYFTTVTPPLIPNPKSPTPQLKALLASFKSLGATSADELNAGEGSLFAQAPYAVVAGLEACGYPCGGAKMAAALNTISLNVPGVIPAGLFAYSAADHTGDKEYSFYKWDSSTGAPELVATEAAGPIS